MTVQAAYMPSRKIKDNDDFIKLIDDVIERHGVQQNHIEKAIGVRKGKISDIRNNRSSATIDMTESVVRLYPDLAPSSPISDELSERLADLERKIAELTEENAERRAREQEYRAIIRKLTEK